MERKARLIQVRAGDSIAGDHLRKVVERHGAYCVGVASIAQTPSA
jgi:hypothetical protein